MSFKYFRDIMEVWDNYLSEDDKSSIKINTLLDGQGNVLYFQKGDEIFGASEDSRVVFAKLKNAENEDDMPSGWEKEANFDAWNLTKGLSGNPPHQLFSHDDLKKIKVIDRESAFDKLKEQDKNSDQPAEDQPALQFLVVKKPEDPAKAANFIQADEEE